MASIQKINVNRLADQTLVMLLAGGQGSRLHELTQSRAKPSLEFGGEYRIIDFPLSNCINSGCKKIGIVTQYKAQCLIRHIVQGWIKSNRSFGEMTELLPASQQSSKHWYRGTADALFQNIEFIKAIGAKYVLVLGGDHIYKMDYRDMLFTHANSGADLTVSCIEVPADEAAGKFGVVNVDNRDRIISFEEKPAKPQELADSPGYVLASMGNYVFNTEFLLKQLQKDAANLSSEHDFGKDVIPTLINKFAVQAFRFRDINGNKSPYWRDVGTIDAYWKANMALLDEAPPIDLYDQNWPVWSSPSCLPPVKFVRGSKPFDASVEQTVIAGGCVIHPSHLIHSVVLKNCQIQAGAEISDALLLPGVIVGEGAKIQRAIIDCHCIIPAGMTIGVDHKEDKRRGFRISDKGIVLVTSKMIEQLEACFSQAKQTKSLSSLVAMPELKSSDAHMTRHAFADTVFAPPISSHNIQ